MTLGQRLGLVMAGFLLPFAQWTTETSSEPPALTLREAIEIVADYDVRHPDVPHFTPYWGVTDSERRVIYVVANADLQHRRETMIHELIHAARRLRADRAVTREEEEAIVEAAAAKLYRELFGSP